LVFFQLGLLRYQDERFLAAVNAFENAVALNNNYDNAIYFLGLSYEKINRNDEAEMIFELLKQKYPDNTEINTILTNLKNGDEPLSGLDNESNKNIEELPIEEEIN
jgi:tetratricopeptide (TPR) repeat protein